MELHLFKETRKNTYGTRGSNPLPLKALGVLIVGIMLLISTSKSEAAFFFRPAVNNQAPTVEIQTASNQLMVRVGETIEIPFEAADANEDELVVFFQNGAGLPEGATYDRARSKVIWTPTFEQAGQIYFTIHAFDGQQSAVDNVLVDVINPNGHLPHLKLDKLIQRMEFNPDLGKFQLYLTPAIIENVGAKSISDLEISLVCNEAGIQHRTAGNRIDIGDIARGAKSDPANGRFVLQFPVQNQRRSVEVSLRLAGYYSFLGVRMLYAQTINVNVGIGRIKDDFGGYNIATPATLYPKQNGLLKFFGSDFESHPENPWNGAGLIPIEFRLGKMSENAYILGSGFLDNDGTRDLVIVDPVGDLFIVTWDVEANNSGNWSIANQNQMRVNRIKNGGIGRIFHGIADYNNDSNDDIYTYSLFTNEIIIYDYVPGANGSSGQIEVLDQQNVNENYEFKALADIRTTSKAEMIWKRKDTGEFVSWTPFSRLRTLRTFSRNGENEILAIADTANDGTEDVIFKNTDQHCLTISYLVGTYWYKVSIGQFDFESWKYLGHGDFDGDGREDLVFLNKDNTHWLRYAYTNGTRDAKIEDSMISKSIHITNSFTPFIPSGEVFKYICDYDGDGKSEILLENTQTAKVYAVSPNRVTEVK